MLGPCHIDGADGGCYPIERPGELLNETMRGAPWNTEGDGGGGGAR